MILSLDLPMQKESEAPEDLGGLQSRLGARRVCPRRRGRFGRGRRWGKGTVDGQQLGRGAHGRSSSGYRNEETRVYGRKKGLAGNKTNYFLCNRWYWWVKVNTIELHVYVYHEVVWSCKRGAPNSRLKMNQSSTNSMEWECSRKKWSWSVWLAPLVWSLEFEVGAISSRTSLVSIRLGGLCLDYSVVYIFIVSSVFKIPT